MGASAKLSNSKSDGKENAVDQKNRRIFEMKEHFMGLFPDNSKTRGRVASSPQKWEKTYGVGLLFGLPRAAGCAQYHLMIHHPLKGKSMTSFLPKKRWRRQEMLP
jgi:hypothetical protein